MGAVVLRWEVFGFTGAAAPREWDACGEASLPIIFRGALPRRGCEGGTTVPVVWGDGVEPSLMRNHKVPGSAVALGRCRVRLAPDLSEKFHRPVAAIFRISPRGRVLVDPSPVE
jgi:hypothetical protein